MSDEFSNTMKRIHEHGKRVGILATSFASRIGLPPIPQLILYTAGRWHDFGKLVIPLEVLNKPGKLTDAEMEKMKNHPIYSEILLRDSAFGEGVLEIILGHHEDWNGGGYPFGLKEDEIPFGSQILRICDVFDALSEQRLYKEPIPYLEAMKIMEEDNEKGKFNSCLFDYFRKYCKEMDRDVEKNVGIISRNLPSRLTGLRSLDKSRQCREKYRQSSK